MQNCSINKAKAMDLKKIIQLAAQDSKANKMNQNTQKFTKDTNLNKFFKKQSQERQGIKIKSNEKKGGSNSNLSDRKNSNNIKQKTKNKQNAPTSGQKDKSKSNKLINSVLMKQNQTQQSDKSLKHLKVNVNLSNNTLQNLRKISSTNTFKPNDKAKMINSSSQKKQNYKKCQVSKVLPQQCSNFSLKDFQLGIKLGKGRFGNVYAAQHRKTKFTLAIKIVNKKQLKKSQMENQLISQIKLQMYINHPNTLKMYGVFHDSLNIYLLLELANTCLFKQLKKKKFFTQQQASYYIKQTIQSLKYLHSQNIIHRDIKPENILISQGVVKLSDFGWSTYSPVYKRQTFCGTLDYVPPEIVEGQYYDQKVDIWSLGVLFYELTTGKAPFESKRDEKETYDKILSGQLTFPESMSQQLKDLISKILKKQPKDRLNLIEIQNHIWLKKHSTVGRHISKEIWQSWQSMKC